ncbi:Erg28 like protein-domain-containing protein [Dipodascopsis tothii]|uniref:Erg28 like protein-domain-containing protein n=1 Tax=Dipodascopsis tothii TaxID=44089 RepID=UPI0034D00CE2
MVLSTLAEYLPKTEGYLPKWLLFISVVSIFNSGQSYFGGLKLTRRVYESKPAEVTGLSARTFGTWTFITSVVRAFGAYYTTVEPVYNLTYATFIVAFVHFASEWLVYGTTKFGKGLLGPLIVSTSSLIWMTQQREFYLK